MSATPISQLKREALAADWQPISITTAVIAKPVMIDGHWVTRPYVLTRGPGGLSDRPAGMDMNAKPQVKP